MKILNTVESLKTVRQNIRSENKSLGLVPTMGNLHAGHLSLVDTAIGQSDTVLATIFVNPTQFGPNEDLDSYPRTLDADIEQLQKAGCEFLFVPDVKEIYPEGMDDLPTVHVPAITKQFEGNSRPGHFDGVCLVVTKLFNLVEPDQAFFGEKDFQQLRVIQKLVTDLNIPVEIISVPTVREANGLAMSSRNNYLSAAEKNKAATLYQCLQDTAGAILGGIRDYAFLEQQAAALLHHSGLVPDYFQICDAINLIPAKQEDTDLIIVAAAKIGNTRILDNIRVQVKS